MDPLQSRAWLFVGSIILLGSLLFGSSLIAWRAHRDEMRLGQSYAATIDTIDLTRQAQIGALDVLRGERGYILTGIDSYLAPFNEGSVQLRTAAAALLRKVEGNASEEAEVRQLQREIEGYLGHATGVIETYRAHREAEALSTVRTGEARLHVDRINALLESVETRERHELAEVEAHTRGVGSSLILYLTVTSIAGLALIGLAVLSVVALRRSMERERSYREDLRMLAQTDDLTGLANRREFLAALERAIANARRTGTPLAFAIFDIDHFKRINDTLGHAAGDAVIQRVASIAIANVRSCDLVGRIGGEEFAILLPGARGNDALAICERLRRAISAEPIRTPAEIAVPITVSTGLSTLLEDDCANWLIERADAALYEAKHGGRDQVHRAA